MKKSLIVISIIAVIIVGLAIFFTTTQKQIVTKTPLPKAEQQQSSSNQVADTKQSAPSLAKPESEMKETGKDYLSAIVVTANSEDTGVKWEYDWLKKNSCKKNSGYSKPAGQALQSENDHWYDVITAVCNDGKEIDYYFMIDNYFGKF
jgi:hypothetical protein